ncbi:MAG: hypothetical protein WAW96_03870, partial [Alphaproteobacteria bacterium]
MRVTAIIVYLLAMGLGSARAEDCFHALITSTYAKTSSYHSDWRLAHFVSKDDYDRLGHNLSNESVIFGIPIGTNYDDYQKRVQKLTQSSNESLSLDQASNILWTGLG